MLNSDDDDRADIRLNADGAVVLFELLSRWSDRGSSAETPSSGCFESSAEPAALNNVLALLERQLIAPFKRDYVDILEKARRRLAQQWSYPTLRG